MIVVNVSCCDEDEGGGGVEDEDGNGVYDVVDAEEDVGVDVEVREVVLDGEVEEWDEDEDEVLRYY